MAKQTICYRSDAGNDFPTVHEALRDDLRHFIMGVCGNEKLSRDLTAAMVDALDPVYAPIKPGNDPDNPELEFEGLVSIIIKLSDSRPDRPGMLPGI